ncbi:hypothetical protein ACP4OV_010569 [Aristida adscensionis]
MASPCMASPVTTSPSSAVSEGCFDDAQAQQQRAAGTAERKRKRKESNRLSAQRSRARKQWQLDDLTAQVAALRARNAAIAAATRGAARRCAAVQAENELLRARTLELAARLQSLAELIQFMENATAATAAAAYNPSPLAGPMHHHQPPLLDATMYNYY